MNTDTQKNIYYKLIERHPKLKEKWATFEEFSTALTDKLRGYQLGDKVIDLLKLGGDTFTPESREQTLVDLGSIRYSTPQKNAMRETALAGLKNLYKGDFDTLINNRFKIKDRIAQLNAQKEALPATSTEHQDALEKIRGLEKGLGIIDAYDAIQSAQNDDQWDALLTGNILRQGETSKDMSSAEVATSRVNVPNKFLRQAMPDAEFVMSRGGVDPSLKETLFPELSEREDEGFGSQALGAAMDVVELPGRVARPMMQSLTGVQNPNISYTQEMSRPRRFKTGGQEAFDATFGLQGLGRAATYPLATGAAKFAPGLTRGPARALDAFDFSSDAIEKVAGMKPMQVGKLAKAGAREVIKDAPMIGLDVGFEGTRPDLTPEQQNAAMLLAGVAGGTGAMIAPSIGRAGQMGAEKYLGRKPLRSEIISGSPLSELSSRAKASSYLAPLDELTTRGGMKDLARVQEELADQMTDVAVAREKNIKKFNQEVREARLGAVTDLVNGVDVGDIGSVTNKSLLDEVKRAPEKVAELISKSPNIHPTRKQRLLDEIGRELALDGNFDLNKWVKGRTKLREYKEGELVGGPSAKMFGVGEQVVKDAMSDILETTPTGKLIKEQYQEMARINNLSEQLPDLTDPKKVDSFLKDIGSARMTPAERTNQLDAMIELQQELNNRGIDVDYITPAVMRRIQSPSFWRDIWGKDMVEANLKKGIQFVLDGLATGFTRGKIRTLATQWEKMQTEKEGTRFRQQEAADMEIAPEVSDTAERVREYIKEMEQRRKEMGGI